MTKPTREEAKELLDDFRDWYDMQRNTYIKARDRTAFLDYMESEGAFRKEEVSKGDDSESE